VDLPWDDLVKHRLLQAYLLRTAPFRGMLLTPQNGLWSLAPTTHGVPGHPHGTTELPPSSIPKSRFMAHSSAWLAGALSPRCKCRQRDEAETQVEQGLLDITVRCCRKDPALH
jgi:hypothetical protein